MASRPDPAEAAAQPVAGALSDWALRPGSLVGLAGCLALFLAGISGAIGAGWGYALLLSTGVLLLGALLLFALLTLTALGDAKALARWSGHSCQIGAWAYGWGVCALGGFFSLETLQGRMEAHWIAFGIAAAAALAVLDVGLYRRLVSYNQVTWRRFRPHLNRADAEPAAMRRALMDEVVLHRTLHESDSLRWWRHTLMFWGFSLMFFTELLAVVFREAVPAFGWRDVWREPGHPLRVAFDFAFDFFGMLILAGCLLALAWRWRVNGTAEQKFSDTPSVVFLLVIVSSGFLLEAVRIAAAPDAPYALASFAGYAVARVLRPLLGESLYRPLWYGHTIGSCLFIAYVPLKRMIHSCATPIGRLMNSQRQLLAAKKQGVLAGLMRSRTP